MKGCKVLERIEISLEKLFDSIRQAAENLGNYDSYSEILSISSHQKSEFSDILTQTIEDFLTSELDEDVQDEVSDFVEDDVFLLSDEDDEDDDEDEDDDY